MRWAANPVWPRRTTPTQCPTAAIASSGALGRTPPTRRCCCSACATRPIAARASSARWWRCATPHDPEPLIAFGRWELELLHAPRGSGGFGYDPVVRVPTHDCSVAELAPAVKNQISHRALAAQAMRSLIQDVWRLD